MNEIIQIKNQGAELVADSRDVAKLFGIQHKNLRADIESHEEQMVQLGVYPFQTAKPSPGSTGGRPEKFYWLTFDHVAFLLTISRPNEQTKEFRLRLILAFKAAREKLRPVDGLLLSIPDRWRKTFPDDFYHALLQLYGDSYNEDENKPSWVGNWTNKFIYEPLFYRLAPELKRRRLEYSATAAREPDYFKLHQFLESHAKEELKEHIAKVTALLQVAQRKQDFVENFATVFYRHQQLKFLLEGLDKFTK